MREQDGGFLITLYKNQLAEEQLMKAGLNDRQLKAVAHVKKYGTINNSLYQRINRIGKTTATEELQQLVEMAVFTHTGVGRGSKYGIAKTSR